MNPKDNTQLYKDRRIRTAWDEAKEEWYFSIVNVVGILTDSPDYNTGRKYWNKLKQRLKEEGSELVTNCYQFRLSKNPFGAFRQVFLQSAARIICSLRSVFCQVHALAENFIFRHRRQIL